MPEKNDGLSELEQDLFKSLDELNEDIDRSTEELEEHLDDFDPDGFLKGVSHEDTWGEGDDEDEDFDLGEEGEGEEEEEEEEGKKKKKRSKVKKEMGGWNSSSSTGGIAEARMEKGLRVRPDPRLKKIMQNQVVMGRLLKSLCETVSPGMRQIANLADAQGLKPRGGQDTGRIGGQVNPPTGLPEEITKAIVEVSFIGDDKQREAAIDQAFAKGLLPAGLTDLGASALYREDKAEFVKTVAPVLVQMHRDAKGQADPK